MIFYYSNRQYLSPRSAFGNNNFTHDSTTSIVPSPNEFLIGRMSSCPCLDYRSSDEQIMFTCIYLCCPSSVNKNKIYTIINMQRYWIWQSWNFLGGNRKKEGWFSSRPEKHEHVKGSNGDRKKYRRKKKSKWSQKKCWVY